VGGLNRWIANPRWRTAAILKNKNGHISATPWPIGTKFGMLRTLADFIEVHEIWLGNAYWLSEGYEQQLLKIQEGRQPPSWKSNKRSYLGNDLTDWREIWHGESYWPSKPYWQLKFQTLKIQYGYDGRLPSWKIENWPYLRNGSTDWCEIKHGNAHWPFKL